MTVEKSSSSNRAAIPTPDLLVSTEWVAEHLDHPQLVLVDVRTPQEYAEGHLPNAINLELSRWTTVRDGVQGMLIEPAAFADLVGRAGIDPHATIILYDANWGMPAARVLWSFRRYGHQNAAVLDGGWDLWEEKALPISQEPVMRPATSYELPEPDAQGQEDVAELSWLQAQQARDDLVVIDTRSPAEYEQGHLPQAINWDWLNAVPVGEWLAHRSADELRTELAALGVTPDREIVTYCRSGARAAHTYMVLRRLGFPRVRNYDGSWLEWSLRVLGQSAH